MEKLTREMVRKELLEIYGDLITEEEINKCIECVVYHKCGNCPFIDDCGVMGATWLMVDRYKVID